MQQAPHLRKPAQWNEEPLNGVDKIIAVASGKGGVGKSTTTVNLARALAAAGRKVGVLDADIYGPSIPLMMGLSAKPETENNKIIPLESEGIKCLSIGLLTGGEGAVIWRGPMLAKALHQMLRMTDWKGKEGLDMLLVDMPPGTGDVHLSMVQQVPMNGAIIVTTPQEVATQDAAKCAELFTRVKVPLVGVIENMSYFADPETGEKHHIFGSGGGKGLATQLEAAFLGEVPLEPAISAAADAGNAVTERVMHAYKAIAENL